MHQLHIMATMRLTRAALDLMIPRGRGGIVNVSSVAGFGQAARSVSYCGTKASMNSFTEGIDMELKAARSPVTIQALCPGFTITEFQQKAGSDPKPGFLWMSADWKYKLAAFLLKYAPCGLKHRFGRPWSAKGAVRATTSERNTSDRPVAWARPVLRVFLRKKVR